MKASPAVDFAMLAATLLYLADKWNVLLNQQLTLAQMETTARLMKQNTEIGADEILDCISMVTR